MPRYGMLSPSLFVRKGRLIVMPKGWFILVAIFAVSLGLITGGILANRPELVVVGVVVGVALYFVRNALN